MPIGGGRFQLELSLETPPEQLLSEIVAGGGRLVSLNPIRETLEELFVERVSGAEVPAPYAHNLEIAAFPSVDQVVAAGRRVLYREEG